MDMRLSILAVIFWGNLAGAAPQAVDDTRTIPTNTPITIDVLNNDSDDEGLTLIFDSESVSRPANGTLVVNFDSGITYTPNVNFTGIDTFTYEISSGEGEGFSSSQATVSVNVVAALLNAGGIGSNVMSVERNIASACAALTTYEGELSIGQVTLSDRCSELMALKGADPQEYALAVRQIAPEETLSMAKVSANAAQFQAKAIGARLMQLSKGVGAASAGGLTWSGPLPGGAAGDGAILSKFGYFVSMQLEDADKVRTIEESGYEYSAQSISSGVDFAVNQDWYLGLALGFTANELQFRERGGQIDTEIINVITYSTYNLGNFSADIQAGVGNSDIDLWRHINYSDFSATTQGNTHGDQWYVSTQLQYLYSWNALTLYPSMKYTYMDSRVAAYADTSAKGWEVELGEQHVVQNTLQMGLQATYAISASWGVFIPSVEFLAFDDLDTDQDVVQGYFAFTPDASQKFGMYGEEPDSYYYQLALGFSLILPKGINAFASYSETLGYSEYSARQLQAGFRVEL